MAITINHHMIASLQTIVFPYISCISPKIFVNNRLFHIFVDKAAEIQQEGLSFCMVYDIILLVMGEILS